MAESSNEGFMDTAKENASNFVHVHQKHSNVLRFLKRQDYIAVRSSSVSHELQTSSFKFIPDVDGCVLVWNDLSYVSHQIRKLYIGPHDAADINVIYHLLKKHLVLSVAGMKLLKKCHGFQLAHEEGWEYWLGLIPQDDCPDYDRSLLHKMTYSLLLQLRKLFSERLKDLLRDDLILNTAMKNNFSNLRAMTVLPDDKVIVLHTLQDSINSLELPAGMKTVIFSLRFGEKCQTGISIPAVSKKAIQSMSAHIAVNLYAPPRTDILWSRSGIQELIGRRGTLTTAMSFYESANFQSNLDGMPMDIDPELRKVCNEVENLIFVQLYADTPHQRPRVRYHPVSGAIAVNKSVNHVTRSSFQRDSEEYISVLSNNISEMRNFHCRLEFVTNIKNIPSEVKAHDYLNLEHLQTLVSRHALLTPFYNGENFSDSIASFVRNIGNHIIYRLQTILQVYKTTGNCQATWNAYQLELALEKLLWGKPICMRSNQLSIYLGVGLGNPTQCKSDSLGFLSLDNWQVAIGSDDTPPPLSIWSSSEVTQKQIRKMFGFHDHIDSGSHIVGRRALLILIDDFWVMGVKFGISCTDFLLLLKGQSRLPSCAGSITVKQISHQLSTVRSVKFPMVWTSVADMLKQKNIGEIIKSGLQELGLLYFPAFRVYDQHRNPCLMWSDKFQYNAIGDVRADDQNQSHRGSVLTQLVISEIENRKLLNTGYLRKVGARPFPWIMPCVRKLKDKKLSDEKLLTVLTFISCVALYQNDYYVSYYALRKLHDELPLRQHVLRDLEIQDRLRLSRFNLFPLLRLHSTIPFKVPPPQPAATPVERDQDVTIHAEENVGHSEESPEFEPIVSEQVVRIQSRHLPSGVQQNWSSEEDEFLSELRATGRLSYSKGSYAAYQEKCRQCNLPDRTIESFRRRITRLFKSRDGDL